MSLEEATVRTIKRLQAIAAPAGYVDEQCLRELAAEYLIIGAEDPDTPIQDVFDGLNARLKTGRESAPNAQALVEDQSSRHRDLITLAEMWAHNSAEKDGGRAGDLKSRFVSLVMADDTKTDIMFQISAKMNIDRQRLGMLATNLREAGLLDQDKWVSVAEHNADFFENTNPAAT